MYCNVTKTQSFPLVFAKPSMLKQIYTSKPQSLIECSSKKLNFSLKPVILFGGINCLNQESHCLNEMGSFGVLRRGFQSGVCVKNAILNGKFVVARGLCSQRVGEGSRKTRPWLKKEGFGGVERSKSVVMANGDKTPWEVSGEKFVEDEGVYRSRSRDGDGGGDGSKKSVPWLNEKSREVRRNKSVVTTNANKSTWEVSAERYLKGGNSEDGEVNGSRSRDSSERDGDDGGDDSKEMLPWLAKEKSREVKRNESVVVRANVNKSSGEVSREKYMKGGNAEVGEVYRSRSRRTSYRDVDDGPEGGEEEEEEDDFEDPRLDKNRFRMEVEARPVAERPELRRWNKQENWGKKIWKEATESTVPRLSGEAIYGVGPVLAAVCAGRRELYALYVQEGLDLSGNNKKKKDKKGVEKIFRMVEKIGLNKSEVSKHDLNMVSDNRPHQGLVLDASPLEMVGIKELEPVSVDEESPPLWVALDEVTDPQNLGAIIRSSYFFGASGVVLCAKNSAPLSGVVSKASAGSLEMVELRSCKNMMQFLTSSAENGWRVIGGSVSSQAVPLDEIAPGAPTIIVLGSEGTGLRPLVERSCSHLVKIPGNAPPSLIARADEEAENTEAGEQFQAQDFRSFMAVESLNVSVAAGVLLHHFIGLNYKHNNPIQETK